MQHYLVVSIYIKGGGTDYYDYGNVDGDNKEEITTEIQEIEGTTAEPEAVTFKNEPDPTKYSDEELEGMFLKFKLF